MVSRSDPGSFQRTTTCIWMPDVRLLHYFEPTQWGSVSGLDDWKRKTKRGWSPGDSLNLVRVLSVRVNYSQQCRNDINGRWEYSKSIIIHYVWTVVLAKQSTGTDLFPILSYLSLRTMGRKTWRHGDQHEQNHAVCGDNLAKINMIYRFYARTN